MLKLYNPDYSEMRRFFVSCTKSLHLDPCVRFPEIDLEIIRCVIPAGIIPCPGNILLQYVQHG